MERRGGGEADTCVVGWVEGRNNWVLIARQKVKKSEVSGSALEDEFRIEKKQEDTRKSSTQNGA